MAYPPPHPAPPAGSVSQTENASDSASQSPPAESSRSPATLPGSAQSAHPDKFSSPRHPSAAQPPPAAIPPPPVSPAHETRVPPIQTPPAPRQSSRILLNNLQRAKSVSPPNRPNRAESM